MRSQADCGELTKRIQVMAKPWNGWLLYTRRTLRCKFVKWDWDAALFLATRLKTLRSSRTLVYS